MENKREKKKKTLNFMFDIYKKSHPQRKEDLDELKSYAFTRIDKCPNVEEGIYCNTCKIHCFKEDEKEEMRKIMKFSGPRMMIYHPILAMDHLISTIKYKDK